MSFVNGSEALAVTRRDKDATWCTTGTLCRQLDWSRLRLLHELKNGLPYRTISKEYVVDWHDPHVRRKLNVEASEVQIYDAQFYDAQSGSWVVVGIEVLPPDVPTETEPAPAADAEVPAPSATVPAASPAPPRQVSEADLRRALEAIVENHPPGSPPPNEESLCDEVERRLGVQVARDRVLAARNEVAPHVKLPVGRPRKSAQ